MKREIKFRVWDGTGMRQPTNNILIDSFDGTANWQFAYDEPKPMWDWLVMQFTGLRDSNGVEIYEGDIVQHEAWDYPFVIIFDDNKARFTCKMKTGLTQYIDYGRLEVIGNIHQNPELL